MTVDQISVTKSQCDEMSCDELLKFRFGESPAPLATNPGSRHDKDATTPQVSHINHKNRMGGERPKKPHE